jgi:general secretion pathway protein G
MRGNRGYSVIELLVALALLGVLASAAMPLADMVRQRERERELHRALWSVRDAIDAYKALSDQLPPNDHGLRTESGYPPNLHALVQGLPDPERGGAPRRFLRSIPRDPFARADLPAASTWRLRSYASDPAHPRAGDDVYDIRSNAPGKALNGQLLSEW